jgi:hypothetical protein
MFYEKKICEICTYGNGIEIYTLNEFIDNVFYPEIYSLSALCIGFNLPFDISRIAKRVGTNRRAYGVDTSTLCDFLRGYHRACILYEARSPFRKGGIVHIKQQLMSNN